MSESLYFIAIVPPIEIQEEVTNLKQLVAEKFESKHALNAPPHITLHMPFKWKDKKKNQLDAVIQTINQSIDPFDIELDGFDFFEPRVVFIDVIKNALLDQLQVEVVNKCRKELKLDNANFKHQAFHPHVTIGFRDLKKKMFYQAQTHFDGKKFNASFNCKKITLLKHIDTRWEIDDD